MGFRVKGCGCRVEGLLLWFIGFLGFIGFIGFIEFIGFRVQRVYRLCRCTPVPGSQEIPDHPAACHACEGCSVPSTSKRSAFAFTEE